MEDLAIRAVDYRLAPFCGTRQARERARGVPGELISRLAPEQRALLQTLRSDDLAQDGLTAAWAGYDQPDDDRHVRIFGPGRARHG
jgi:hypothetical protein